MNELNERKNNLPFLRLVLRTIVHKVYALFNKCEGIS